MSLLISLKGINIFDFAFLLNKIEKHGIFYSPTLAFIWIWEREESDLNGRAKKESV